MLKVRGLTRSQMLNFLLNHIRCHTMGENEPHTSYAVPTGKHISVSVELREKMLPYLHRFEYLTDNVANKEFYTIGIGGEHSDHFLLLRTNGYDKIYMNKGIDDSESPKLQHLTTDILQQKTRLVIEFDKACEHLKLLLKKEKLL